MKKSREQSRRQEETIARIWTQHRKNEEQRKVAIAELLPGKDIGPDVDINSPEVVAELEKHGVQRTETSTAIYKHQNWFAKLDLSSPAQEVLFRSTPTLDDRLVATTQAALHAVVDHTTPAITAKIKPLLDENTPIDEIVRTLKPKTFHEDGVSLPLRADASPTAKRGKDLLSWLFDLFSVLTSETHDIVRYALDVALLGERVLMGHFEPDVLRGLTVVKGAHEGGKNRQIDPEVVDMWCSRAVELRQETPNISKLSIAEIIFREFRPEFEGTKNVSSVETICKKI
jgi:hypothetical protein